MTVRAFVSAIVVGYEGVLFHREMQTALLKDDSGFLLNTVNSRTYGKTLTIVLSREWVREDLFYSAFSYVKVFS